MKKMNTYTMIALLCCLSVLCNAAGTSKGMNAAQLRLREAFVLREKLFEFQKTAQSKPSSKKDLKKKRLAQSNERIATTKDLFNLYDEGALPGVKEDDFEIYMSRIYYLIRTVRLPAKELSDIARKNIFLAIRFERPDCLENIFEYIQKYELDIKPILSCTDEHSPLHCAVAKNNFKIVEILIQHGADIHAVCRGMSAKDLAIGCNEASNKTLQLYADVDYVVDEGTRYPKTDVIQRHEITTQILKSMWQADVRAQEAARKESSSKLLATLHSPAQEPTSATAQPELFHDSRRKEVERRLALAKSQKEVHASAPAHAAAQPEPVKKGNNLDKSMHDTVPATQHVALVQTEKPVPLLEAAWQELAAAPVQLPTQSSVQLEQEEAAAKRKQAGLLKVAANVARQQKEKAERKAARQEERLQAEAAKRRAAQAAQQKYDEYVAALGRSRELSAVFDAQVVQATQPVVVAVASRPAAAPLPVVHPEKGSVACVASANVSADSPITRTMHAAAQTLEDDTVPEFTLDFFKRDLNKKLQRALEEQNTKEVAHYSACGADVNAVLHTTTGTTPLIAASRNGSADVVQLLLKHKADTRACDVLGNSALMNAALHDHGSVVSELSAVARPEEFAFMAGLLSRSKKENNSLVTELSDAQTEILRLRKQLALAKAQQ